MDFSLIDYMDEGACYDKLVMLLHPGGFDDFSNSAPYNAAVH